MKNAFILILLFAATDLFAQISYVDPFIGTGKSNVLTRWGSEGGVYPGAVAPNGFMQLTPQTRAAGYDYSDSSISFFSCTRHFSGFPTGSAGELWVMPMKGAILDARTFSHKEEKATPGYYRVRFTDDGTLAEMTATERAGMFRFTFPGGTIPAVYVSDTGHFKAAVRFSEPYERLQPVDDGYVVTFKQSSSSKVILLSVSASTVSKESAERNIAAELSDAFDKVKEATQTKWEKALSVITVTDTSATNKTIFYTALYHSLLMPWIISDVDGHYRGADKQVHTVKGRVEYGGFSPWDTYRSLHPLLCLLYPYKQADMIFSMLDIYEQTGFLPTESMTGNHSVPIIADSYLKGIPGIDSSFAYTAMKKSIGDSPHLQQDMGVYQRLGYIPFSYSESVTRTVEYAYDDWALAQFARQVMHNEKDYRLFIRRSYNYRNLFHPADMFMLPRSAATFKLEPGNSGYKEGDKWVYTYFVPQHPQDLINLLGGEKAFVQRLDTALLKNQIVFDNETVFHVPYLFNAAGEPALSQYWVRNIMHTRFSATPGGLPGNDDLGSTSSWYVLSALGFYPVAPGVPEYSLGLPLFQSLKIHLLNGKTFEIKRTGDGDFVGSVRVNNQPDNGLSHATIMKGGEMVFNMVDSRPSSSAVFAQRFYVRNVAVSKKTVVSDEAFRVRFTIQNKGSLGTMQVSVVSADGVVLGAKNCLVDSAATITDSITCKLYRPGKTTLVVGDKGVVVTVTRPRIIKVISSSSSKPSSKHPSPSTVTKRPSSPVIIPPSAKITDLTLQPLIPKDSLQQISYTAQNIGPDKNCFDIPVRIDSQIIYIERDVILEPGEQIRLSFSFTAKNDGWHRIIVNKTAGRFKTYSTPLESVLLDLSGATDKSGFGNNGKVIGDLKGNKLLFGKDCYVEVPNAANLDVMGNTMTMMAWVYPVSKDSGLVDMITKGDSHVLQTENGKTLTFFAGGWGRGDVTVPLPPDWKNHWHHIAGVCYGDSLKLYIDGHLKGTSQLSDNVNLSGINKWTLGRNEEFPSVRIFNGYIDNVKIFAAPLSENEIGNASLR